jgi:hypothetical protein
MNNKHPEAGWWMPMHARKFHWYSKDGFSLCGKWRILFGSREVGNDKSPDNCAECKRRIAKLYPNGTEHLNTKTTNETTH